MNCIYIGLIVFAMPLVALCQASEYSSFSQYEIAYTSKESGDGEVYLTDKNGIVNLNSPVAPEMMATLHGHPMESRSLLMATTTDEKLGRST